MRRSHLFHLLVLAFAAAGAAGADHFSHRGKTVDAATNQPLGNVAATAYGTRNRLGGDGACPKYDGYIDDDTSTAAGSFVLNIPKGRTSYFVTYCRATYEALTPESNDNISDSPVTPEPVRLWPLNGEGPQMASALKYLRDDAAKWAMSLRRSDAEGFTAALQALPAAERELLSRLAPASASTDATPLAAQSVRSELPRLAESVDATLRYFASASPGHFATELQKFVELSAYARTREIGVVVRRAPRAFACMADNFALRRFAVLQNACSPACPTVVFTMPGGVRDDYTLRSLLRERRVAITRARVDKEDPENSPLHSFIQEHQGGTFFVIGTVVDPRRAEGMTQRVSEIRNYVSTRTADGSLRTSAAILGGAEFKRSGTAFLQPSDVVVAHVPCSPEQLRDEYLATLWDLIDSPRIASLFRATIPETQAAFLTTACRFCSTGEGRPAGVRTSTTAADVCYLIRKVQPGHVCP